MRISDWSSDVCSSDLQAADRFGIADDVDCRVVGGLGHRLGQGRRGRGRKRRDAEKGKDGFHDGQSPMGFDGMMARQPGHGFVASVMVTVPRYSPTSSIRSDCSTLFWFKVSSAEI